MRLLLLGRQFRPGWNRPTLVSRSLTTWPKAPAHCEPHPRSHLAERPARFALHLRTANLPTVKSRVGRQPPPGRALPVAASAASRRLREARAVPGGRRFGSGSDPPRGMPRPRPVAWVALGTAGEMEAAWAGPGRAVSPAAWEWGAAFASAHSLLTPNLGSAPKANTWRV